MTENIIRLDPNPKQQEFLDAVFSNQYSFLLYGGAIRGGKTVVLIMALSILCRMYPKSRWAIIRKDLPRLKRNFIPSWEEFAPKNFFGPINRTDWSTKATNGSEVIFFPANEDRDPLFNRLRGLEISGAVIEECNEVSGDFFDILTTRIGTWVRSATYPNPMILMSCNPNQVWPKTRFYDPWRDKRMSDRHFYLPAFVTDNPKLTPEYLKTLELLRVNAPERYKIEVEGSWDAADAPDQLFEAGWVDDAYFRDPVEGLVLPKRLAVDVARFGDDDTVLINTEDYHLKALEAWQGIRTTKTTLRAKTLAGELGIRGDAIRVDAVGVGAGVADQLFESDLNPFDYKGGKKPAVVSEKGFFEFKNRRSADHWHLRELFKEGWISVDPGVSEADRMRLRADLLALRYDMDDKMVIIKSKKQIKKELGRSPDYSDALVMAFAEVDRKPKFRMVSA